MRARAFTVDIGSPEYHALQDAKNALGTLNAERAISEADSKIV